MRIIPITAILACTIPLLAGCGSNDSGTAKKGDDADRTKVVAAFYPLAWAAEQVGDDSVEVTNLTPPGVEPHDLELTPKDVATITEADVVIYLGRGFQPAVEDAIERSGAKKIDVLAIEGLTLLDGVEDDGHGHGREDDHDEDADDHGHEEDDDHGHDEEEADPHVWLDPTRLAKIAEHLANELEGADSTDAVATLTDLDRELTAGLKSCERRELFTSHAAFGYLADRYDLEQIAISGISPDAEPLAKDLERVAREAKEHGATTIFFETLVSPKLSEQVAREVGAKTAVLDPLEGIDQERLDDGVDFIDVMRENLASLRTGLDCA